ncbi:hypothetical protein [Clostridium thailandense]|uniref:hypothetical protein n=1 Tax=Clostridium thailandense TaxID=2794346 RepID=UPI003989DE3D
MDTEQLNILGAQLAFLGDGLLVLAAEKEAGLDQIKGTKEQEEQKQIATELNICGNFIVLLGDTLSLVAGQQEAQETFKNSDKVDCITLEATQDNLTGGWLNVIGDVLNYRAAILIAQVR